VHHRRHQDGHHARPFPVADRGHSHGARAGRPAAHRARRPTALAPGFVTDNGNHILDVHDLTIADPVALERELNQITAW